MYRELALKHLNSPRRERALWRLGRISLDAGEADAADQAFAAQLRDYPKGPYAGDAYVRLIDNALEYRFDLAAGKKAADVAVAWAEGGKGQSEIENRQLPEPWRLLAKVPNLPVPEWVEYEVYLRAGLVRYLEGDFASAVSLFKLANPKDLKPVLDPSITRSDLSLNIIRGAAERNYIPWDQRALEACQTDVQRLAIKLADLYTHAVRADRALEIYQRFENEDKLFMPLTPDLRAYVQLRLASSWAADRRDVARAMTMYRRFYEAPLNKSAFASDAILRLGVLTFNTTQDGRQSMPHYEYIFKRFPEGADAERAMYFYTLDAISAKQFEIARRVGTDFCNRYANSPNSLWRDHVRARLRDLPKAAVPQGKD